MILSESDEPLFTITASGSKATVAAWCALDQYIVTGHENGTLNLWDMVSLRPSCPVFLELISIAVHQDGELFYEKEERGHSELITDMQMSPDGTYLITSSKDKSAKVSLMTPQPALRLPAIAHVPFNAP